MKTKLIVLLFLILGWNASYACTCKKVKTVKQAYKYHESIVYGKVLRKTLVTLESTMNPQRRDSLKQVYENNYRKLRSLKAKGILKIEVEIIKEFKGRSKTSILTIYTPNTREDCGYTEFEVGKEYLIYGSSRGYMYLEFQAKRKYIEYERKNTFWTVHCYRTKEYLESEAKELGELM
ncbi:hypothetical protein [uncultured Aquimarina sp.]|uniref:hypothetical protein n=1 Tax=uncultured Aquimarina sp. TaxID=575652 RepID=UPI002609D886|nr:hypothetical protein [uncultured Aquimarina sp.]